jgi:hypothetical protein
VGPWARAAPRRIGTGEGFAEKVVWPMRWCGDPRLQRCSNVQRHQGSSRGLMADPERGS